MAGSLYGLRTNLSFRRFLIELNLQVDFLKDWIDTHGRRDYFSSLHRYQDQRTPQIIIDILLLEDRRFYNHRGAEVRSIPRGIKRRIKYGRFGGVSTIDQLLVRTCTMRTGRTMGRKTREVCLAILLNLHCSKKEILHAFVNSAYFGPRLNGADSAAKIIFGAKAVELEREYSAFIASLLPYPLPSKISRDLRRMGPCNHPSELLQNYMQTNPWWVERVAARMSYVQDLRLRYSKVF